MSVVLLSVIVPRRSQLSRLFGSTPVFCSLNILRQPKPQKNTAPSDERPHASHLFQNPQQHANLLSEVNVVRQVSYSLSMRFACCN